MLHELGGQQLTELNYLTHHRRMFDNSYATSSATVAIASRFDPYSSTQTAKRGNVCPAGVGRQGNLF